MHAKRTPETRFWAKVRVIGHEPNDCWMWTACVARNGYGLFNDGKRTVLAHRWSFAHAHGDLPPGSLVCHACDTPACVRPDHLFLGDHVSNAADMVAKGRASWQQPGTAWSTKLDARMVAVMRYLYHERGVPFWWLAQWFPVPHLSVKQIVTGVTWKHVPDL